MTEIDTAESTASAASVDLTTTGPSIVIPRAGVYIFEWGAHVLESGAGGGNAQVLLWDTTANASTGFSGDMDVTTIAGAFMTIHRALWLAATSAHTYRLKYNISNGISVQFSHRYLRATPVRVS